MITSELAGNYIKLLKSSLLNALYIENEAKRASCIRLSTG